MLTPEEKKEYNAQLWENTEMECGKWGKVNKPCNHRKKTSIKTTQIRERCTPERRAILLKLKEYSDIDLITLLAILEGDDKQG